MDTVDISRKYPLTVEQCKEIGGHCYEVENMSYLSNPPQSKRTCKHCGHTQWGRPQPSMKWG